MADILQTAIYDRRARPHVSARELDSVLAKLGSSALQLGATEVKNGLSALRLPRHQPLPCLRQHGCPAGWLLRI